MGSGLAVASYTLAAIAGVCFFSGLAIISGEGEKRDGEARDHHVDVR